MTTPERCWEWGEISVPAKATIRQATVWDSWHVLQAFEVLNTNGVKYFTLESCEKLVKESCVGLISDGVDVVGACALDFHGDSLEIFALGVTPCYQKMGIGTKFLKWAETLAKQLNTPFLYANSYTFYNATAFYERNGFSLINEISDIELPASYYTFLKLT